MRDAEALERLEAVDTLVVDKTGTLTLGQAAPRRRSCRAETSRRRSSCASRRASSAAASIRSPPRSSRAPRSAGIDLAPVEALPLGHGEGRRRARRRDGPSRSATAPQLEALGVPADDLRAERRGAPADGQTVDARRGRRPRRGHPRRRRSGEGVDARGAAALRADGVRVDHGDRRQPHDRGGGRAAARASPRSSPRCCPRQKAAARAPAPRGGPRRRDGGRRRQRRAGARASPTSASRWARGPTWRSRAPASRS